MEINYKKLLYVGIAYDAYPQAEHKLKKNGLPIKRLEKELPYVLGEGRMAVKKLQVYYALLPQYSGKGWFTGKPKKWKPDRAGHLLEEVQERGAARFDCREQVWGQGLNGNYAQMPLELMAVCLFRQRPFDRLCISLSEDEGERGLEQVTELVCPYLPRIRQVVFQGNESNVSERLEEYLYDEFGIVMTRACGPVGDMPWLDFRQGGEGGAPEMPSEKEKALKGYISHATALKFLDTVVKNSYNTDVNSYGKSPKQGYMGKQRF